MTLQAVPALWKGVCLMVMTRTGWYTFTYFSMNRCGIGILMSHYMVFALALWSTGEQHELSIREGTLNSFQDYYFIMLPAVKY
jgi:hypothetical protein